MLTSAEPDFHSLSPPVFRTNQFNVNHVEHRNHATLVLCRGFKQSKCDHCHEHIVDSETFSDPCKHKKHLVQV